MIFFSCRLLFSVFFVPAQLLVHWGRDRLISSYGQYSRSSAPIQGQTLLPIKIYEDWCQRPRRQPRICWHSLSLRLMHSTQTIFALLQQATQSFRRLVYSVQSPGICHTWCSFCQIQPKKNALTVYLLRYYIARHRYLNYWELAYIWSVIYWAQLGLGVLS